MSHTKSGSAAPTGRSERPPPAVQLQPGSATAQSLGLEGTDLTVESGQCRGAKTSLRDRSAVCWEAFLAADCTRSRVGLTVRHGAGIDRTACQPSSN